MGHKAKSRYEELMEDYELYVRDCHAIKAKESDILSFHKWCEVNGYSY